VPLLCSFLLFLFVLLFFPSSSSSSSSLSCFPSSEEIIDPSPFGYPRGLIARDCHFWNKRRKTAIFRPIIMKKKEKKKEKKEKKKRKEKERKKAINRAEGRFACLSLSFPFFFLLSSSYSSCISCFSYPLCSFFLKFIEELPFPNSSET